MTTVTRDLTLPATIDTPVCDVERCPTCGRRHRNGKASGIVKPCGDCRDREVRAAWWIEASPVDQVERCGRLGVGLRFCRNGKPPSLDDPGLAEQIAARPLPAGGLYVCGPIGAHKSHLIGGRAVDASRRGWTARLLKWQRFCLEVRDTYKSSAKESEQDVLKRYVNLDYLGVDDLGVGRGDRQETDASLRLAYVLLDARYEANLVTDVTSNLLFDELVTRFDQRIGRRIAEMCSPYVMRLTETANDATVC